MSSKTTTSEKIKKIIGELDSSFVERKKAVRLCLLAMLSGEHAVLLGPPGTAKSLLVRTICEAIEGGSYFDYLLTRFTTPDEIFGPLSIKKLEEDIYERQTKSYLPEAHIAFLDEIFKANSSILNSLLTLINERMFHNGSQLMKVPLRSIFGASNETPEDETLNALYDRFLVRILVNSVEQDDSFSNIVFGKAGAIPIKTKLTIKELDSLLDSAEKVKVPKDIQDMVIVLKRKLAKIGVSLSDRRWKHLIGFLRTLAAASNRNSVRETDLLLLQDMLWEEPSQIKSANDAIWETVVADEHAAKELQRDVKSTKDAFEKNYLKTAQSDYYSDKPKKEQIPLDEVNSTLYTNQIQEIEKGLKSAKEKVSDRRKKYEGQMVNNLWVEPAGLIEDIDKEISELVKVDQSLSTLNQEIQNWPKEGDVVIEPKKISRR